MSWNSYEEAERDPVALIILEALHAQDARTHNGDLGDIGQLALDTAAALRPLLPPGVPGNGVSQLVGACSRRRR